MFLHPTSAVAPLTPRQDFLQARLAQAISNGSTRSALRETVDLLVDHLRLRGIPASRGLEIVIEVASRAANATPRSRADSIEMPFDRLTLVSRWATARYSRAD
jgi:hypothetical protein